MTRNPLYQEVGPTEIRINNQVLRIGNGPLQVAVINRNTGEVISQAAYDPFPDGNPLRGSRASASDSLADVIEKQASGTLVAVAAQANAITHLSARAKKAISMIGGELVSQLQSGDRWVIAGMKGVSAGSVMEAANRQGGVALEAWWPALPPVSQKRLAFVVPLLFIAGLELANVAAAVYLNQSVPELDKCFPKPTLPQPSPDPGLRPARRSARKALFVGMRYLKIKRRVKEEGFKLPEGVITTAQNHRRRLCNLGFFAEPDAHFLFEFEGGSTATAPTRSNVLKELAWLIRDAKEEDVLYFHYLGHGASDTSTAQRREALSLLSDDLEKVELLYDLDLLNLVAGLSPRINLTMVFHSCHSGGMTEEETRFEPGNGISIAAVDYDERAIYGRYHTGSGLTHCLNRVLVSYRSQSKEWPTYRVLFNEITACHEQLADENIAWLRARREEELKAAKKLSEQQISQQVSEEIAKLQIGRTPVIRYQGYEIHTLKFLDSIG